MRQSHIIAKMKYLNLAHNMAGMDMVRMPRAAGRELIPYRVGRAGQPAFERTPLTMLAVVPAGAARP